MDQEMKDFLTMAVGNLTSAIGRLEGVVDQTRSTVQNLQIQSTARTAELQKDIDNLRGEIVEIKQEQKTVNDSQKFKWKSRSEEKAIEKKEQAIKDEKQAVINNGILTLTKLMWIILGVMLSIAIGFVWQLIVSGGIKGLVP